MRCLGLAAFKSTVEHMEPQWKIESGAYAVTQSGIAEAERRIGVIRDFPLVLHQEAPGPYSRRVLEELEEALAWLLWTRRVVIDEALHDRTLSLREIANASGVAVSTLQKWKATPLPSIEHDGSTATGPGIREERRKSDY